MKIITDIYLKCDQGLKDDWLLGGEAEINAEEAKTQEDNMNDLTKWYNQIYYTKKTRDVAAPKALPVLFDNEEQKATWEELTDNDLAHFDVTFVNNYENWLEQEVFSLEFEPQTGDFDFENEDVKEGDCQGTPIWKTWGSAAEKENEWKDFLEDSNIAISSRPH